ncbi:Fpg/Nei family DNA glycosylase [Streptomyces litchfieldiae]|uniref:DNA-formamidopyrimidine glycosylase family protein n=1 Tax=Streptomyces litchfieldiae TaxID=3075543 RepID=A0ABU2MPK3_9ACTN|nr:DNA-formamidopyrimidine glycosylase family protein [Streptomyces sp. DSM 44938]MDT0343480.1 DNA-formamidopyrimidine glycosylase family protein [Streptomyces sp. DSM 44938]
MPELPDVEGFRRVVRESGQGRRITGVSVADPGVLRGVTPARLRKALTGRRLTEPERHGKWLVARTDGPAALLHFGMTGRLLALSADDPPAPHDRVTFDLDDGQQLRYRDQRKLQGLWLAPTDADIGRIIGDQGPDALSLTRPDLDRLLEGRRGRVKSVLTDQAAVAGLGNLLADEILWRARIRPARPARDLGPEERHRLADAMRQALRSSVRAGHVPTRPSWLTGHRDDPEPVCPRCSGPLRRDRVSGRGTVWCPRCQRDGD